MRGFPGFLGHPRIIMTSWDGGVKEEKVPQWDLYLPEKIAVWDSTVYKVFTSFPKSILTTANFTLY